jgi:hypothetical protein
MLVTVISDASFAIKDGTNAAGWACYIACMRGKRYYGNEMRVQPLNTTVSEVFAVVNALHSGLYSQQIERADTVLFQVDCIPAIEILKNGYSQEKLDAPGKKRLHRAQANEAREKFYELIHGYDIGFEFRHIKAHCGIEDPRFFVHNEVDLIAKKHMSIQAGKFRQMRAHG